MEKVTIQKRSYSLALAILNFAKHTHSTSKDISTQIVLKQLIRSGTSIGANVAEAQAGSSQKDFIQFLNHALKSARESIFWLNLLKDTQTTGTEKADLLLKEVVEVANILGSSIITLRKKL